MLKTAPPKVRVHNKELTRDLAYINRTPLRIQPNVSSNVSTDESVQTFDRSASFPYNGLRAWLSAKSLKDLQERTPSECGTMKTKCYSLLSDEQKLQEDLDRFLASEWIAKDMKTHLLFKKWSENVYEPLQKKIDGVMNGKEYKQMERRKVSEHDKYLKHRNKKGHVFLDIFDREEYDPLLLNRERPGPLKVSTKRLKDPLLLPLQSRTDEKSIVEACDPDQSPLPPLTPVGRASSQCSSWLEMELKDIHSEVRQKSQKRYTGVRNVSTLVGPPSREEKPIIRRRICPLRNETTIQLT